MPTCEMDALNLGTDPDIGTIGLMLGCPAAVAVRHYHTCTGSGRSALGGKIVRSLFDPREVMLKQNEQVNK